MDVISQLKRDEGFQSKPYRDSVGKLTIGYGTNIEDGIDKDEADFLILHRYVERAQTPLRENLPWTQTLDPIRLAVLENMCYNLGLAGLLEFRNTLASVQAGNYAEAAKEMLDSKWATQVGARAQRLAQQMETGVWV